MGGAPMAAVNPFQSGYTNTPGQVNQMSTNVANGQPPAGGVSIPNISPTTNAQFARVAAPQVTPPPGAVPSAPIGGRNPLGGQNPFQSGYASYMKAVNPNWNPNAQRQPGLVPQMLGQPNPQNPTDGFTPPPSTGYGAGRPAGSGFTPPPGPRWRA
jgi:hypothetical protein